MRDLYELTATEERKLRAMGFFIGGNAVYLLGADGAPGMYVWPGHVLGKDCKWFANPSASEGLEFDDVMAAAVWLKIEASNLLG
jgi:hypothetical protein